MTTDQVLALAPDQTSAKAGQALATPHTWLSLGCDEKTAWGERQGSGKNPYQTQIYLLEPAFRCSCPSRKFPCKHAIGLFLLFAGQPQAFTERTAPKWVTEWLDSRADQTRAEKQTKDKKGSQAITDPLAQSAHAGRTARAKRAVEREARVAAGLSEIDLWLRDLVRGGLAAAQTQPLEFWERAAARLVDAQAPGVARLVRQLANISSSRESRHAQLLERLSRIHLLSEGFKRLDQLPAETQADIRSMIGWTQSQDDLLNSSGVRDEWQALGRRVVEEDRLRIQRTWLWGRQSERFALLLEFAAGHQPLNTSIALGSVIDAELVFYPGAFPLRALIKERFDATTQLMQFPGKSRIHDFFAAYAAAISINPWLEIFPAAFRSVVPVQRDERWFLRDAEAAIIPIAQQFGRGWTLLALSGGREIDLFGEWDGEQLWPLSAVSERRFIHF